MIMRRVVRASVVMTALLAAAILGGCGGGEGTVPLVIRTADLPDGAVGEVCNVPLFAGGGTRPYQWAVTDGALPDGLALSTGGVLFGTPTEAGFFNVTITVTDDRGETAARDFEITIAGGAP